MSVEDVSVVVKIKTLKRDSRLIAHKLETGGLWVWTLHDKASLSTPPADKASLSYPPAHFL